MKGGQEEGSLGEKFFFVSCEQKEGAMGDKMLFISYWELNQNSNMGERLGVANNIITNGLYPPEGVNVLRFDIAPGDWGVSIFEADNSEAVFKAIGIWRSAMPGFFKSVKVSPALEVKDAMPLSGAILQSLAAVAKK